MEIARKENRNNNNEQFRQKSDKTVEVDTKKELAQIAGVSHDTIHKVEVIEHKGSEEIKERHREIFRSPHRSQAKGIRPP